MTRLLFLSHAGIDSEAARALKRRILNSPAARESGLTAWFDKDDLRAGEPWQDQLDEAIRRSDAFAVYVGSRGVVNWVGAEVRSALSRAVTEGSYRFIPILSADSPGAEALPGFARQFQGVFDVESRADEFEKLLAAILGGHDAGALRLEAEPFFGLRAIDESRSHLFFGREAETKALLCRVHRSPLVLVTGDSGSGKSSLVRAGLVPRFRGGALAELDGERPGDNVWHVVTTRPRNHPLRQLGEAVDEAAKGLGLPLGERGTLADWAASGDPEKVRRALCCDLPPEHLRVLLVVDQFEELLTVTPPELRQPFVDLLLDLADPTDGRHHVVLTMRHDYVNLCRPYERLQARLDDDDRRASFLLGRMSDEGLRRIVTEPLRLAGVEAGDREALAGTVVRDVGQRPGDLALVQMALTETWRARDRHDGNLLRAYAGVGRVEGALAQAAERVRTNALDDDERALLDTVLLRLVRLGDTGGATRRAAARSEFDEPRWQLIQKLAGEEGRRLVLLGGSAEHPTVEIAHEALVTAWPHFQNLLQEAADQKRVLDALIDRGRAWETSEPHERGKRLATGADLEVFTGLSRLRRGWLSETESRFVESSTASDEAKRRRQRLLTRGLQVSVAVLLVTVVAVLWMWLRATRAEDSALASANAARANESRALTALSEVARSQHQYIDAVKLALAAWPRTAQGERPKLRATVEAMANAQRLQRQTIPPLRHDDDVWGASFNRDHTRILTWSVDGTARVWAKETGKELLRLDHKKSQPVGVGPGGAVFNSDETAILTWAQHSVWLWNADDGSRQLKLDHQSNGRTSVLGASFNSDGSKIISWGTDYKARFWNVESGEEVLTLRHPERVSATSNVNNC